MRFLKEEGAQATTEYVLLLSVLVGIAILIVRELVAPGLKALGGWITDLIERKMFRPGSMHQSPFRMPSR